MDWGGTEEKVALRDTGKWLREGDSRRHLVCCSSDACKYINWITRLITGLGLMKEEEVTLEMFINVNVN